MAGVTSLDDAGKQFIQQHEGLRLTVYDDGVGVLTIGWGHTGPEVNRLGLGASVSLEQAQAWFDQDIAKYEDAVNRYITVPLNQNQFNALTSFCYNLGAGIFSGDDDLATLVNSVEDGNFAPIADKITATFSEYSHGGGRILPGLLRRRQEEAALFLSGVSPAPASASAGTSSIPAGTDTVVHKIQSGDDIRWLAWYYGTTVGAICDLDINSDVVDTISLTPPITKITIPDGRFFTISDGQTIRDYAKRYNTTVGAILSHKNNSDIVATIKLDGITKITIPGVTLYKVQSGDTIQKLARRYGTTVGAICNVPVNSDVVATCKLAPPITKITVAPGQFFTIQDGDTLQGYAQKYKTTIGEILDIAINSDIVGTIDLTSITLITIPGRNGGTKPS